MSFSVQNRPAFEFPYSEVSNTNLAGKNEVAVEFALPSDTAVNGANGQPEGSTKNRGRKAAAGRDELVEMRFYIPGTVVKAEKGEGEGEEEAEDEEKAADGEGPEEQNAANLFYETLLDKAEIGEVAGDTFATFLDVLHLTPRSGFPDGDFAFRVLILVFLQRPLRHRYVRKLLSVTWKDIRLQDSISIHQEIFPPPEERRYPYPYYPWFGPPPTTRTDPIPFPGYAAQT